MLMERFVMDTCTVVELMVLKDNTEFPEVRSNLGARLQCLKDLEMLNATLAAAELLRK